MTEFERLMEENFGDAALAAYERDCNAKLKEIAEYGYGGRPAVDPRRLVGLATFTKVTR